MTEENEKPRGHRQSRSPTGCRGVPSWVALGRRLRWWSQSQQKFLAVIVTKVDEAKKVVIATFESDKKVWKSVPFSKLADPDCPLKNLPEAKDGGAEAGLGSKETKREGRRSRSRSRTPDWWTQEKGRIMGKQPAIATKEKEDVVEKKRREAEKRREEALRLEEQRRREIMAAEKRKVEEAFEKRKKEAEQQKMREEEEWRENLRRRREKEAAEEEILEREKEERRKKRREEKDKKKKEEDEKASKLREAKELEDRQRREAEAERTRKALDEQQKVARMQAAAVSQNVGAWGWGSSPLAASATALVHAATSIAVAGSVQAAAQAGWALRSIPDVAPEVHAASLGAAWGAPANAVAAPPWGPCGGASSAPVVCGGCGGCAACPSAWNGHAAGNSCSPWAGDSGIGRPGTGALVLPPVSALKAPGPFGAASVVYNANAQPAQLEGGIVGGAQGAVGSNWSNGGW